MGAIARAELLMLVRNRLVLVMSVLFPLGFGAFFIFSGSETGSAGYAGACVVVGLTAMGTYTVITTTIAARRQTHLLKRLRSTAVTDAAILVGVTAPIVLLNAVQVSVVLVALRYATGESLSRPWLLFLAVALAELMFVAFALATAGVTGSPESAQYTCLPLFLGSVLVALWALMGENAAANWLPGGGLAVLAQASWSSGALDSELWSVVPTLGWALVGIVVARMLFRWDARSDQ